MGIPNDTAPPHYVHIVSRWDIEMAITDRTVAIGYAAREGAHPPLEEVVEVGRANNIPVIVDAAAQLPPARNLHRFIDEGADLVAFSWGKGMCGPQASGILCGRKDLIASAALQMLDMAGSPFDEWFPADSLIPKDRLRGKPQHGVGRGFKVSKEAIAGLMTALDLFTEESVKEKSACFAELLQSIADRVKDIPGMTVEITGGYPEGFPLLVLSLDEAAKMSASEVLAELKMNRIYLRRTTGSSDRLSVHPINLDEDSAAAIAEWLRIVLTG